MIAIHLRDVSPTVVAAWEVAFAGAPGVQITCGDIFGTAAEAILSPANGFGFMDGGIDLVYSRFFGWELQERLQALLLAEHFGELPVGQAVIVPTGHASIPFLVSAPTMRVPSSIARTLNVYFAFRAALIAVTHHNGTSDRKIGSLLVPGLGTGVGDVPAERAARQMRRAFDVVILREGERKRNVRAIWDEHRELLS